MERVRTARSGAAWAGWDSGGEEFASEMDSSDDQFVAQWGRWQRGGEVGHPPGLSFPLPPEWPAEEGERPEATPKAGRSSPPWDSSDDECLEAMDQAMGRPMCHAKKKMPVMVSPAAFREQQLAEEGNGGDDEGNRAIISSGAVGDDGGGAFAAGAEGDGDCGDYGGDDGVDASVDAEGNNNGAKDEDRVMLICECCPDLAIFRRVDVTGDPENDDKLFCASCWEALQMWHPWARGGVLQQGVEIMAEDEAEQHKKRLTRKTSCSRDGDDKEIPQQEEKQQSDGKPQKANDDGSKETVFTHMKKGNPRCAMNDACVGYDQDDVVKVMMPKKFEGGRASVALMNGTMYCIPCWRQVRKRHDTKLMVAVLQDRMN